MSKYYCPNCFSELEEQNACGSVSYFCDRCKGLVSRSKMLTEEAASEAKEKQKEV